MPKTSITLAIMTASLVFATIGDIFAGPNTKLPFSDDFEFYNNGTPLIDGTNGWYASSSSVMVQSNTVLTGSNAAIIPEDCTLSNLFQNIARTNVWIKMDVRPSLYDGTNNPVVDTNQAGVFYVNSNGNFVVHNGPATDPTNSTRWVVATNVSIGTNGTNWVQISIYANFLQTNWDLYANGIQVTNSIGFVKTSVTNFSEFDVYNGATTSYLDNVSVTAPGMLTLTPTSLVCHVMQGLTASNQNFLLTAETDVWNFANSTSVSWLSVNPVTGTVDSATAGTNLVVSCATQPDGSYTGTVSVRATNSYGTPQATTGTVTLHVMDLQVAPTNLAITNGIPVAQTFWVWNAGGATFNYTAQPLGNTTNWLSLSASNGVAGSNAITVQYRLGPTNYVGTIMVASSDGGGATSYVHVTARGPEPPVIEFNPAIVTQRVAKGSNPANDVFTIRNGSATPRVPMEYTLVVSNRSPELIQTISSSGGSSTGQANSVTINYMDISLAPAGSVYTSMVNVAAWDAGTNYAPTGIVQISASLMVKVEVVALIAPSWVTASDGTYTTNVVVTWGSVPEAVNYKIYRSPTFNPLLAEPIGEAVATIFNDLTGQAGVLYYYWVSSVNAYRGEGPLSTNRESGYRGLAAPGGLFATDGAYTNKVRVTWPLVDGATGYQLYRGIEGNTLAPVYFTAGGVYEDMTVLGGVHYEYKVAATNGVFGSVLSVGEIGYAFGTPSGFAASKGTYVDKVRLTWNAVESASEYEVWRSARAIVPPTGGAIKMASLTTPMFDDVNVSPGAMYYYWVRGNGLEAGIGGWSAVDRGYAAAAGVDLWVDDLVILPVQVGLGSSPTIVSFRMGNGGGTNIAGVNGTIGMEFFASTNPVFGTGGEVSIGKVVGEVTLAVGADMVMKVAGSQLVTPATEGDYYIFVRVLPEYPSLLADINPNDNVAMRNGSMRVRSSGGLNYQVFNDYDGDGMSDLGVYRGTEWSIRSVDERVLVTGLKVFDGAGRPVLGDLDGDHRSDPIVHDSGSGIWQVLYSGSSYMWASGVFGVPGYRGLVADYEGDRHGDASVFHEGNGRWYVLKSDGSLTVWNWGEAGYEPVTGDYDGDGHWDMAVYQEASGLWYIRTLSGQLPVSGAIFGGPGCRPVPGDYDGDGCWDAAIYVQASGKWYIASLDGRILGWGIEWGAPGFEPVMGDYDGDGKWDLGVYQETTGMWYIRSLDGRILAWTSHWGGAGYRPIGN